MDVWHENYVSDYENVDNDLIQESAVGIEGIYAFSKKLKSSWDPKPLLFQKLCNEESRDIVKYSWFHKCSK